MMNSKKIISSVSLTTAILATGILSQEAHADDLTPNTNATAPATTETVAPTASKQAESKPVTQADVTSAETTYNQATAEVATAQADVNAKTQAQTSAQTAVNTATPAVTDAKRDAAEATPEGIAKAEKAITTAESDVTAKENAVESAKTEQTKADKDVEAKANQVTADQKDVDTKVSDVKVKEQNVADAKAVLDGTGASKIIANQEKAKADQATAQSDKDHAEKALAEAKTADAKRESDIKTTTADLSTKEAEQAKANQALTQAQKAASETADAERLAHTAKLSADAKAGSINTVNVPAEYIRALKASLSAQVDSEAYDQAIKDLKAINQAALELNAFKSNPEDSKVVFSDINNLPEDVRTNLSLFTSDLVNQIRTAFGTPKTDVTKTSVAMSDAITDAYVKANWNDINAGHYSDGIHGVQIGSVSGRSVAENMNSRYMPSATMTLDTLKSQIYDGIMRFMFNGYEWAHAMSIAGLNLDAGEKDHLGADFSFYESNVDKNWPYLLRFHVNTSTKANDDDVALANSYDSTAILAAQASATAAYNKAKAANDAAQLVQNQATEDYAVATTNVAKAKALLANLEATPLRTANAQADLDAKAQALKTANETLKAANEAVANLNADIKTKTQALENAKAELTKAKQALKTAESKHDQDQAVLENAKANAKAKATAVKTAETELASAQATLKTAKDHLANLKDAPARLAKAQSQLATAEKALETAKADLKAALATLETKKAKATDAKANFDKVSEAYAKVLEAERQRAIAESYAKIVASGQTPVPVVDANGNVVGYRALETQNQTVKAQASINQTHFTSQAKATAKGAAQSGKTLPETGEVSSALHILGSFLVGLGLAATDRRKRRG